jgi:DNA-binding transcriptional LysR family regulator
MGSMYDPISEMLGVHRIAPDGSSVFDYASFTQDIQEEGVILLDELSRATPAVNNILLPCLDSRRALPVEMAGTKDRRSIPVHPKCRFVATANIGAEYTGTNMMDRALMDRFFPVELTYMPADNEAAVLIKRYGISMSDALNIVRTAATVRSNYAKEELGTTLFIRGKRHLKLTEAGSLLYRRAVQLLELAEQTAQEIQSLNGLSGTVNVSVVDGRAPFLLARWIAGFRAEFPEVKFRLWNGSGDEVLERLNRGLADLAVVAAPYDTENLEGFPVSREPWVAMIPAGHPLARTEGECIPLRSLVGEPLIVPSRSSRVNALRSWFAEIGAEPNIVCELSNYLDAEALTEQSVGICIFPQTTYTPNPLVSVKLITSPAKSAEYVLVHAKDHPLSEPGQAFKDYVSDYLKQSPEPEPRVNIKVEEFKLPPDTPQL